MKYLVRVISLLLISSTTSLAQLNIDDFRGAEWGTHIDEISFDDQPSPSFSMEGKSGPYVIYSRDDEDYALGTAKMSKIHYHFTDNKRLTRVILQGEDDYNEDIESILQKRLGNPNEVVMYKWEIVRVWEDSDVTVILREKTEMDFVLEINSKWSIKQKVEQNTKIDDF